MAVIKRADAETIARQAVTLHLGDLHRQGSDLVDEAVRRAEAIVNEANAERNRLLSDASEVGHAEGYAKGHAEGLAKGREEGYTESLTASAKTISEIEDAWVGALDSFERERARMLAEAKRDVVRLAAVFAEKIVKRAVELDETVVERQLEAALASAVRPSRLAVAVHPDDAERARNVLPRAADGLDAAGHAEIVEDASLRRGSCVARMGGGAVIDASIDTQITRMVETLLPGEGGARDTRERRETGDAGEPGEGAP